MDPRKRETDQLAAEIAKLEQQIGAEFVAIGKHITGLGSGETRSFELNKYLHSVHTLKKSEDDFREDITRIRDTVRRLREMDDALAGGEQQARALAKERESRFVELGAGAYTLYKSVGEAERDRYRAFFEDILKLDLDIARLEGDLKTLEEDEKKQGIFEKLRTKGRKIVVRGQISRIEKQKIKAFGDAGAKVAESEFAARSSGDLRALFDFAADKRRALDAVAAEDKRLREEAQRQRETLRKYGIDGEPDARCDELEKRIADVRRELDVMYAWMGQLFMDRDLRAELADNQLGAKFEIVQSMRQNIARKRVQINRLRAELESEDLERKEKVLRARRKQLEEDLKVKERQIAVVDLEINTGQRRIEELRKVITGEAPYRDAPAMPPGPDFSAPPRPKP